MSPSILKLEEFGDIVEYVSNYIKECDWVTTLRDAESVEFNDGDY